jgi:DNA-binding beta-propeller fold protein YncE
MKSVLNKILTLTCLFVAGRAFAGDYHVAASYAIDGDGSYDYVRFDAAAHRLYIAHEKRMEVLDSDSGKKIGEIGPTDRAHGVALVPEVGRGFVSSGNNRSVVMFDLKTLKTLGVIKPTGVKPDSIQYDPETKLVYCVNGGSTGDISLIDPAKGAIIQTISIGGTKLENIGFDGRGHAFINDEEQAAVHVLDLKTQKVTATWSLKPGEGGTGLAVDREHHRIFSACSNNKLVVLDSDTGKVVATPAIGADPDGAAFDDTTGTIFTSNNDGTLTVIHEDTPDQYTVVQTLTTEPGCKTIAIDAEGGRVFLPTAKFGAKPAPTKEVPEPRPVVLPGTFHLVVVSR